MSAYHVAKVSLCLCGRPCLWSPSSSVSGFRLLFFPSALSLLVSHHYSFSESLLSLLKYASRRVSREAQRVCNLGWLTHCKKSPCVCAARRLWFPARGLVPTEPSRRLCSSGVDCDCASACLRYLMAICRNTASCLRSWLDCQSHFGQTLANTNTQQSSKREKDRGGHLVLGRAKQNEKGSPQHKATGTSDCRDLLISNMGHFRKYQP